MNHSVTSTNHDKCYSNPNHATLTHFKEYNSRFQHGEAMNFKLKNCNLAHDLTTHQAYPKNISIGHGQNIKP